jgi:hypothetical protein
MAKNLATRGGNIKSSLAFHQAQRHEDRGSAGIAPPFLISVLDGGEWSTSQPYRFTSGEAGPGTHWIGGWVGPRADLDITKCGTI